MADLHVFIEQAVEAGAGRRNGGARRVPAFVAAGQPDEVYDASVALLTESGFRTLDLRVQGYEQAVREFGLSWPVLDDEPRQDPRRVEVPENERLLLILCGDGNYPRFWQHLRGNSVLYTGAAYPPMPVLSPRCVVVPDTACVCALVKATAFDGFAAAGFDPVFRYESTRAVWED